MLAEDIRHPEKQPLKGGRTNIKDKKRDKRIRDGDPSRGGSREGGDVSKHQETLSPADLWGEFWNLRGHHNREEKKTQNTCLTATPSAHIRHQQVGAKQGGTGYIA